MKPTQIPEQRCWLCGYKMNRTSEAFGDRTPKAGDVSICLSCGAIQVFTEDLRLRVPTDEEREKFMRDPRITEVQIVRAHLVGDQLKPKRRRR